MTGLLVATVQMSAILLVGLGLASLLRRQAASFRHAILTIAMACAALAPLLGGVLPAWSLAVIPSPAADPASLALPVAAPAHQEQETSHSTAAGQLPYSGGSDNAVLSIDVPAIVTAQTAVAPRVSRSMWAATLPQMADIAWRVYLCGLALSLALLAAGALRVGWISMHAVPVGAAAWQRQAQAAALAHGLRRFVRLKRSTHASLLATWGCVRPEVLLPDDARDWPEDRIKAVLLHELAHVRRNDWVILLLAGVLRGVYWFNPLVWIACRRLREEAEQACDDAAIGQGMDAADYAAQLLALARECARPPRLLAAAPSMARPSTLRRRVAGILDPATTRARPAIPAVTTITVMLLAVTGIVAACDVTHRTALPQAAATPIVRAEVETGGSTALPDSPTLPEPPASRGPAAQPVVAADVLPVISGPPASPQQVVAGVLELVSAALANESTAVLDEVAYPITGLQHVQRYALAVVDDEGRDPATLAANCVEIINALVNTGNLATNVTRRPRGARLSQATFDPLAAALHAKAAELSDVLMPVSAAASPAAFTPVQRAAADALDLAQATLRDVSFVGPRQGSWLVTELDTLERAASSVIHGPDGRDGRVSTLKWHALQGSLRSTARQASQIAGRSDRPVANRGKAAALVTSLQGVTSRLDAALAQPGVSSAEPMAVVLARVTEDVHGLRLATMLRIGDMFVATLGGEGVVPLNVVIEDAPTEGEAMQKEERSVFSAPATGFVQERKGLRVHSWGGEQDAGGYRVLARIGRRVVNVSAPPELSGFVLPVFDGIAEQLR